MDQNNVVSLKGGTVPAAGLPQPALIDMMEVLLAKAKSGELQSLIGTGFCADGTRMAVWANLHPDFYQMLGALTWLQHEYIQRKTCPPSPT